MILDEKVKSADVALICMPFMATDRPSLGLSLIKAGLTAQGVSSSIYYLNLSYAMMAGLDKINTLELFPEADLIKEWIFTESCWGENKKRDAQYTENVLKGGLEEHRVHKPEMKYSDYKDEVLHCKDKIESFLKYCINEIPWSNYKIVGFSLIFQQQISSISLAKRIKKQFPHLFIVFGGASCKGESGKTLLKSFPFIDAVCPGEGDIVFPQFVRAFLDKKLSADFPGIITQTNKSDTNISKIPPSDLNELPYPDYQDFFQQVEQYDHLSKQNFLLMLESSRGCWWGEKSQCSFCGLNGTDLRFRQKTAKNVLDEIIWMLDEYGSYTREFWASDCIMPKEYIKTLLPKLKKMNLNIKIFYEIKSNQKREHIQLFHEAGVTGIQPGIESLSTSVLKLMGKGVTSLQNIQLLKNCLTFGIFPQWHYLVGFPGETSKDYEGQSELIQAMTHLPPPHFPGIRRIRFDRFSPYHSDPGRYNLQHMHPYHSYQYIFPTLSAKVIEQIAYYFVCDFNGRENIPLYTDSIKEACKKWLKLHHKAALFTIKEGEILTLYDFRPGFSKSSYVLKDDMRMIFEACEQIQKRKYLKQLLNNGKLDKDVDEKLDSILDPMLQKKWIIEENNQFLNLAIGLGFNYFPPEGVWHEFGDIMNQHENI